MSRKPRTETGWRLSRKPRTETGWRLSKKPRTETGWRLSRKPRTETGWRLSKSRGQRRSGFEAEEAFSDGKNGGNKKGFVL